MTRRTSTPLDTTTSRELFARATAVTPGGVNSPVRAMQSVNRDHPLFISRATRAVLQDADGNEFVDWMMSWGALPLGHAPSAVVEAIAAAVDKGTSYGAPTKVEVELAELITFSAPSVERIRFTSSGTEATMSAVRVARAATGREAIITFAGNYHGHADPFLATGGSGLATLSIPSSPGVPEATAALSLQSPWGDAKAARQLAEDSAAAGNEIAAIIVEPVAANMGVIEPPDDFLPGLRKLADDIGAVLIFDEVITGFRVARGGAQELYGIPADLTCYGKIIGGGLPVGAFGGNAELMQQVAPSGSVYQAGTLSGNPLAMTAGLAQLRAMVDRDTWTTLNGRGRYLEEALNGAREEAGVTKRTAVSRVGSLVTLFHNKQGHSGAPRNFADTQHLDTEAFARTHAACLQKGQYLPPSQFEALFVSTVHTDEMIERLADAVQAGFESARD